MKDNAAWENAVLWLRAQPERQELVRACYYDDPLLEAARRYEASEEWQAVCKILPNQAGGALDLGAGRGISSYALAKAGWKVDALEPDPSAIVGRGAIEQLAAESALPIRTLEGIAEQIPAQDETYDLVYGRQVMHHARNLQTMCGEVFRVLKPGGVWIATREHVISRRHDLAAFLESHPLHRLYGGENAFLLEEYLGAIRAAGLRITQIFGPYDSVINYFPETEAAMTERLHSSFRKYMGAAMTRFWLNEKMPWTNWVNRFLARRASRLDASPGRLYTFLCRKPK
ncbi:MAG: class I SAM-dependent methyltransferase [Chloroflexi bacterium]|nr:class I SAM-dependent methyltransferase [Chloroflexota bacterium]